MKEKAMEVPRTLTRTIEDAAAGPHPVIERAPEAASTVVDRFASGTHRAVDKIADAAAQAVNTLGVKGEELKGAQVRVMDACRSSVREHPVTSLAIALAAGFVLSRLLRSRSNNDPAA
jgi:ElaB/YqjD/DUF883 family membrane-anchored ribosome-binding protein